MFFVKKADRNGYPYFIIRAANGKTLVTSESYYSNQGVLNAIDIIKRKASSAEIISE